MSEGERPKGRTITFGRSYQALAATQRLGRQGSDRLRQGADDDPILEIDDWTFRAPSGHLTTGEGPDCSMCSYPSN